VTHCAISTCTSAPARWSSSRVTPALENRRCCVWQRWWNVPRAARSWSGDKDLSALAKRRIPYFRRHIGVVFQDARLLFDRTVFDNVALPLVIAGYPHNDTGRRVRAALDQVGLLGKERAYPVALSGGEQQRVGIARAVVNKPAILLADEPTGNLDPMLSREIMALFERFNQFGVTMLIATHDVELLGHFRHRIVSLRNGSFRLD